MDGVARAPGLEETTKFTGISSFLRSTPQPPAPILQTPPQLRVFAQQHLFRSPSNPPPGAAAFAPPLTCQRGRETEGVVAVALPVARPVAADPRPTAAAARGARCKHRVTHGALEQPARVTPV